MGEHLHSLQLLAKFVPLFILFLLFQLDSSGSKSRSLARTLSKDEEALSTFITKLYGPKSPKDQSPDKLNCSNPVSQDIVIKCSPIDNDTHITEIDASEKSLDGFISDDVTELKYLRKLFLYNNKLRGDIPGKLGILSHLTELDLSNNLLNGSIPPRLGNLTNLSILYLSSNQLTGPIPQIWDNMKKLEALDLSENRLTGSIPPSLGTLKSLTFLNLQYNELSGTIPRSLGNLSDLQYLILSVNFLNGRIPQSLWNLSSLQALYISFNKLSGEFPSELARLSQLEELSATENELTGTLPRELALLKNIQVLSLGSSKFVGDLPTEFYTNLTNLIIFNVRGNMLTGAINPNISKWRNLTYLYLLGNYFTELPPEIFGMTRLRQLLVSDLDRPPVYDFPNLTELQNLETLVLRNCKIHAAIPEDIGKWSKGLRYIDLSFNKLWGKIPNSLGNLNLTAIFLTRNMLHGKIPDSIKNKHIVGDLSQNYFNEHSDNFTNIQPNRTFAQEMIDRHCPQGKKSKYNDSLFINCGGEGKEDEGKYYDADTSKEQFYVSPGKNWAYACSGDFGMNGDTNSSDFIKNMTCTNEITLDNPLYKNARLCPQSLTYYAFCLRNGNYIVKLHFAEIVFAKDEDHSITGRRVFDIYIQGKQLLKNFNIKEESKGPNKNLTKKFEDVNVNNSHLEIQLYWAGKGSFGNPYTLQGPLISAIQVTLVKQRGLSTTKIVGIVIATALAPLLFLAFMWRMGWLGDRELRMTSVNLRGKSYTVKQIKDATRNFSQNNVIGNGRFGIVYKAELPDHQIVAVKKLSFQSKIDQIGTEVYALKQLKHENIVELLDVYSRKDLHLLIYEYMEKGSLKKALSDDSDSQEELDWEKRVDICLGTARGLKHLHEDNTSGEIVHRNVKASNILLDGNFNAKISDLGLAKLYDEANPFKFIEEIGTAVYMAPEYAMRQPITVKADVYGYGIVLVEIVSGKSNSKSDENLENDYLLNKACVLISENRHLDLVDENLSGHYDKRQAVKILDLAMKCINLSPNLRPAMSEVVSELERISKFETSSA